MSFENPSREKIKLILEQTSVVAVVGLSDSPDRTSHMVAQAMQARGYRIIPVNPNAKEILGETCYPSLLDIPEPVDIVNVFRRSEQVLPIAEQAVQIKAKVLWLQQGIINEEAAELCQSNGMEVIMDRCIKVEDAVTRPNRS
ncbi:CoA-binding protein [Gorillibacterium massiliense]|uniref:CoA-binding protein n=1 Tax=Gorillibacterium massiliense TaxID=1280390 RepID=UPI0004B7AF6F|nr:CoA-binding protein [Gorillibacterium massiliense]